MVLDAPRRVRSSLHGSKFRIVAIDDLGVHLEAQDPMATLAEGTPVALWAEEDHLPLEGLVVGSADGEVIVTLPALSERRHQLRASIAVNGELQLLDVPDSLPVRFTSTDLSEGGVRVRLTRSLSWGDRVFITLDFPPGMPVMAVAEVLDSTVSVDGGEFEARLRFTCISEESRLRLALKLTRFGTNS